MRVWVSLKRMFCFIFIAISILILVSLIPLSFKEGDEKDTSDVVISSLSLLDTNMLQDSRTYFNVSLEMIVYKPSEALQTINSLATNEDGVVMASSIKEEEIGTGIYSGSASIEIDSNDVENFLQELQNIGQITQLETYTNNDVLVIEDADSWIENLQMQQSKYQLLLSEATTLSEVIQVEDELSRIQTEIDRWEDLKSRGQLACSHTTIWIKFTESDSGEFEWMNLFQSEVSSLKTGFIQTAHQWSVKAVLVLPCILCIVGVILAVRSLIRGGSRKRRR